MIDLPVERYAEVPTFSYCGEDIFGPYLIKERRSKLKRYRALFTYFTYRAMHIEVTSALNTTFFIVPLRTIMARKGAVRSIWSDNGTNFVGTRIELQQGLKEMNHDKIRNFLQENRGGWIDWHNNPAVVSHMGGVWERQIQTARNILEGLLQTNSLSLNDESLRTLILKLN